MAGRRYVEKFTVAVGPVKLTGSLYGLQKTESKDSNKYKGICPDCATPTIPKQTYVCPTNPKHAHPMSELARAKDVGGSLVRVAKEKVVAARASELDKDVFIATVHPAEQVANATWHASNSYVFVPDRVDEWYALLVRMVVESGKAFVAEANVKNHEGFYRLAEWQNHLVLQRLHWPSECETFTPVNVVCDDKVFQAGVAMLAKIEQPFDGDAYRGTVKQKLEDLEASVVGTMPVPVAAKTAKASKPDLFAVLAAFDV